MDVEVEKGVKKALMFLFGLDADVILFQSFSWCFVNGFREGLYRFCPFSYDVIICMYPLLVGFAFVQQSFNKFIYHLNITKSLINLSARPQACCF